ncbi:hypothetical protein AGLY_010560 [Aphis glycines]|uniref:Uncharacterized protein n=1 Tax=Aphis glycines TaxID=307491 RepID=A0A6G0TEI2_APHGL|nr:hypothetical protein AGLY_010560 [Aphis glycines]
MSNTSGFTLYLIIIIIIPNKLFKFKQSRHILYFNYITYQYGNIQLAIILVRTKMLHETIHTDFLIIKRLQRIKTVKKNEQYNDLLGYIENIGINIPLKNVYTFINCQLNHPKFLKRTFFHSTDKINYSSTKSKITIISINNYLILNQYSTIIHKIGKHDKLTKWQYNMNCNLPFYKNNNSDQNVRLATTTGALVKDRVANGTNSAASGFKVLCNTHLKLPIALAGHHYCKMYLSSNDQVDGLSLSQILLDFPSTYIQKNLHLLLVDQWNQNLILYHMDYSNYHHHLMYCHYFYIKSYSQEDEENDNGGLEHAGENVIQRRLLKKLWWTDGRKNTTATKMDGRPTLMTFALRL